MFNLLIFICLCDFKRSCLDCFVACQLEFSPVVALLSESKRQNLYSLKHSVVLLMDILFIHTTQIAEVNIWQMRTHELGKAETVSLIIQ